MCAKSPCSHRRMRANRPKGGVQKWLRFLQNTRLSTSSTPPRAPSSRKTRRIHRAPEKALHPTPAGPSTPHHALVPAAAASATRGTASCLPRLRAKSTPPHLRAIYPARENTSTLCCVPILAYSYPHRPHPARRYLIIIRDRAGASPVSRPLGSAAICSEIGAAAHADSRLLGGFHPSSHIASVVRQNTPSPRAAGSARWAAIPAAYRIIYQQRFVVAPSSGGYPESWE